MSTDTYLGIILCLIFMSTSQAHAVVVTYELENVVLDDGTQMTGTFSWTFDVGDFGNGVGRFSSLVIPWTSHDHHDLDAVFDIGSSIEITLEGSVHDDGLDITLFLAEPLTPTGSSSLDLVRSKYEIGGNGFHDGLFLSGSISPAATKTATPTPTQAPTNTSATTHSPTASPTSSLPPCTGDCGKDGFVTIDDLVRGVQIALGTMPLASCSSFDSNWDGEVAIDELLSAVKHALTRCPA